MSDEIMELNGEDLKNILNGIGKSLCILLDFLPSKELSFPIPVEGSCTLLFTISKK